MKLSLVVAATAIVLMGCALGAIPNASASPDGDQHEIALDASVNTAITAPMLEDAPVHGVMIDATISLPDIPVSIRIPETETGDVAPAGISTTGESSRAETPLGETATFGPPQFFYSDGSIHPDFAFTESSSDLNDQTASGVEHENSLVSEDFASLGLSGTEAARETASSAAAGEIRHAPNVRYHLNTRHFHLGVTLEKTDDPLDAFPEVEYTTQYSGRSADTTVLSHVDEQVSKHTRESTSTSSPKPSTSTKTGPPGSIAALASLVARVDPAISQKVAFIAGITVSFILATLYSLFQSKDVLKSEIRRKIYTTIEQNPGITIIHLSEIIGVRHQTICYHLQILKKAGHVTCHQKGNKVLHFVNGAGVNESHRELLAIERGSPTMRVLLEVLRNPSVIKKDVALAVGLTRTGGAWHVNKLVKLGLVAERKERGQCRLFPIEERVALMTQLHGGDLGGQPTGTEVPVQLPPESYPRSTNPT